jgi:hypothetical protein
MSLSNNFAPTKPSLQLNFASGANSLDPRITFTRSTAASYVNKKGYIAYAGVDQPRLEYDPVTGQPLGLLIEDIKKNYVVSATDFTSNFSKWSLTQTDSNLVLPNRTYAPDGTLSADLVLNTTTSGRHTIQSLGTSVVTTLDYTASVFVKAYENTIVPVAMSLYVAASYTASDRFSAGFNVAAGTLNGGLGSNAGTGLVYKQTAEYYGNGWYRISVSGTTGVVGTTSLSMFIGVDTNTAGTGLVTSYTGDGGAGFYVWGAQLEDSKQQTSFIPSSESFTSRASTGSYIGSDGLIKTATSNTARYTYSVLDLSIPPRLLYEPAATNLYNYSEQINTYSLTGATVTANNTTSPDGTASADKLVENTSNSHHDAHQTLASVTAGVAITVSAFFKAEERSMVAMEFVPSSSFTDSIAPTAFFSLTTGTTTNVINMMTKDTSIISYGNGWYRCSATVTPLSNGTLTCNLGMTAGLSNTATYTGDGASGLYIWGAQAETGNVATSYIATGATTVTRSADVMSFPTSATRQVENATIEGANFNSWFNTNQGTLVSEGMVRYKLDGNQTTVQISGAYQQGLHVAGDEARIRPVRYGSNLFTFVSIVLGEYNKIASSYNISTGNISARVNGSLGSSETLTNFFANTNSSAPTDLRIGRTTNTWYMNGWIKSVTYYPEEFTSAQLIAVTNRT